MILDDDDLDDPEMCALREMELDPTFVPCRSESCEIEYLHREHKKAEHTHKKGKHRRERCPKCDAPIAYELIGEQQERARCASCKWRGYVTLVEVRQEKPFVRYRDLCDGSTVDVPYVPRQERKSA